MSTQPTVSPVPPLVPGTLHPPAHRRHRALSRWLSRIGLVAGGLAIAGGIVRAWLPQPVAVDVAAVRHGPLDVEVDEDGRTQVRDRYAVAAPITGDLQRIELD
ncbi:MAG TPA: hypothetical protein VF516_35850, partial [Kofleriaceae bacterium]